METFEFVNGISRTVHDRRECVGRFCVIHNPSLHSMVEEPMLLRETGLVERVCRHGVGHPDPDSAAFFDAHGPIGSIGTWTTHGCCSEGCCSKLGPRVTSG